MFVVLICASAHANARDVVRIVAADHGLHEDLPSVYLAEMTPYRRTRMVEDLQRRTRNMHALLAVVLTFPDAHFMNRVAITR
jgi:hypothetical protein